MINRNDLASQCFGAFLEKRFNFAAVEDMIVRKRISKEQNNSIPMFFFAAHRGREHRGFDTGRVTSSGESAIFVLGSGMT